MVIIALFLLLLISFHSRIIINPVIGLAFWLGVIVGVELLNIAAYNSITISGVRITALDILFAYFSYIALIRYRFYADIIRGNNVLGAFIAFLIFIAASIPLFVIFQGDPLMRSINGSRDFIIFIPAFLYFLSFRYDDVLLDRMVGSILFVSCLCSVYVLILVLKSGERVVPSSGALFISFAALIALTRYYKSFELRYLLVTLFLLAVVVLLRHRSVWIATAMGLIFIHLYSRVNFRVIVLVISIPLAMLMAAIFVPETFKKFSGIVNKSASALTSREGFEESTGGGRVARWEAQIKQKFNWKVWLWGNGHAYDRDVYIQIRPGERRLSTVSFHNHYLEQAFRLGIPTVIVLLFFIFEFLRANHRLQSKRKDFFMIGISACVFGTLGFGMMYSYSYVSFLVMGLGSSILVHAHESMHYNADVQSSKGGKKLALDAWKYKETSRPDR